MVIKEMSVSVNQSIYRHVGVGPWQF